MEEQIVNKYNDDDSKCDNEDESCIWVCYDYGTGDSIDISKPSKGHPLRRREMDVIYENIKGDFKLLKKCMRYDTNFVNYLLGKTENYDQVYQYLKQKWLKIYRERNNLNNICRRDQNNDITHSVCYLLIQNNVSLGELNEVFKIDFTDQKWFNWLDDDLFDKINLFHSKNIKIDPFTGGKYCKLEDYYFILGICMSQDQVIYRRNTTDEFIKACKLYNLKVSPKAFDKYDLSKCESEWLLGYEHCGCKMWTNLQSTHCQNLRKILDIADFEFNEKIEALKKFITINSDYKPMLIEFDMKQFNGNNFYLIDNFTNFLDKYNLRINKTSIMKDVQSTQSTDSRTSDKELVVLFDDNSDVFVIGSKSYNKTTSPKLWERLSKLIQYSI